MNRKAVCAGVRVLPRGGTQLPLAISGPPQAPVMAKHTGPQLLSPRPRPTGCDDREVTRSSPRPSPDLRPTNPGGSFPASTPPPAPSRSHSPPPPPPLASRPLQPPPRCARRRPSPWRWAHAGSRRERDAGIGRPSECGARAGGEVAGRAAGIRSGGYRVVACSAQPWRREPTAAPPRPLAPGTPWERGKLGETQTYSSSSLLICWKGGPSYPYSLPCSPHPTRAVPRESQLAEGGAPTP